jgi:hypothetical protein
VSFSDSKEQVLLDIFMEQESNEGIAYLRALRRDRPISANPGTSPPGPYAEEPPAERPYQGADKRRSPRHKCEGSVEMREEGCDVRTWSTFTDVSLNGCYVEAQATYPVGVVLHLKLEAKGTRVETEGTVRVSYPYLGMGIAFTSMSEENRTRLRDLLGSVSRPSLIMGPGIASALPASGPLGAVPLVSNPGAAIQALVEFFESRHMLMREDFLRVLQQSQIASAKR